MWRWIFLSNSGKRLWTGTWGVMLVMTLFLGLWPLSAPVASTGWDKSDHLVGFAALTMTGMWMLPAQSRARVWLWLGLLLLGGLIEVLQMFIPMRQGDLWDWLADAIGVGMGAAVGYAVLRWVSPPGTLAHSGSADDPHWP